MVFTPHGTSRTTLRRLYTRLGIAALVAGLLAGAYVYLDYQFRLAEVGGAKPCLAASDRSALRSLLAGDATVSQLQEAGRIFSIRALTRCKLVSSDSGSSCRGPRDFPVRVQLLEGPRRGQAVWLCFADIRWPLHPLP